MSTKWVGALCGLAVGIEMGGSEGPILAQSTAAMSFVQAAFAQS